MALFNRKTKSERYLIRAEEIAAMEGAKKTHFLNKNAQRVNKSLGDLTGLTGLGFHIIEVAPGHESTEYHQHIFEDECVFVLAGIAQATIGKEVFTIKPGDFIGYRKGGAAHTIKNAGREVLRMIVVGERLAHDVTDYPNRKKRLWRQKGLPANLVDHAKIETPALGTKK